MFVLSICLFVCFLLLPTATVGLYLGVYRLKQFASIFNHVSNHRSLPVTAHVSPTLLLFGIRTDNRTQHVERSFSLLQLLFYWQGLYKLQNELRKSITAWQKTDNHIDVIESSRHADITHHLSYRDTRGTTSIWRDLRPDDVSSNLTTRETRIEVIEITLV